MSLVSPLKHDLTVECVCVGGGYASPVTSLKWELGRPMVPVW